MKRLLQCAALGLIGLFFVGLISTGSFANKDMFQEAREVMGKDKVKNCKYCHVKPLPKEDDHELNEVGTWLVEQKEKRGAEAIDVEWLKEYKKVGN